MSLVVVCALIVQSASMLVSSFILYRSAKKLFPVWRQMETVLCDLCRLNASQISQVATDLSLGKEKEIATSGTPVSGKSSV